MITPEIASIILICMAVFLIAVIPVLDGSKRFGKYISLRYTLVTICTLMALGCVLDFSHLMESSRNIVLMGAFILVGIFVGVRSLEKVKLGSKKIELEVHKGDVELKAAVKNDIDSSNKLHKQDENNKT